MANRLTGKELNIIWCHECYLLSRLQGASKEERQRTHQQLVTHPEFNHMFSWRKPHRWLVQWDLPDALFTLLFAKYMVQVASNALLNPCCCQNSI
ncbi:hypothetical protein NIES4075_52130 [Tolypothrix sp. NIES-4075]|uniref:hypothetical protein n=1 Tax=Tolypothrix sp. NIES-4075 TaxID=2005459 RepID=UPI000B5CE0CD|nr:hypothetical protein [Tolypothrix sp. NIES-4075]GAX44196.1 hypothetical protein NIES4075_52130 [Tolypothrix sp. NIES-4075]